VYNDDNDIFIEFLFVVMFINSYMFIIYT